MIGRAITCCWVDVRSDDACEERGGSPEEASDNVCGLGDCDCSSLTPELGVSGRSRGFLNGWESRNDDLQGIEFSSAIGPMQRKGSKEGSTS